MTAAVLAVAVSACKKIDYDHNAVIENMKATFYNDTIDANHTWKLYNEHVIGVTANVPDVETVALFTGDPYGTEQSFQLAQCAVTEGETVTLTYSIPNIYSTLFAAAITKNGTYYVTETSIGASAVDFSDVEPYAGTRPLNTADQEMYYCFSSSYPEPSKTWDFNDVVLRVSKQQLTDDSLRISVTLEAVGALSQMAAALRLYGVKYDEIESVKQSKPFVRNEELTRYIITSEELLLKGRHDEAVLNLFDDAHAAFYSGLASTGSVYRYYYNVSHQGNNGYFVRATTTVDYDIKFKTPSMAGMVSYERLDPFIAYGYGGIIVETHKFAYQQDEVLFSYFTGNPKDYVTGFTWVVEVPYNWFRYPLEGNAMGSYKNGALYGSYNQPYHSFGEWAADRSKAQDWYLYPSTNMVY